MVAGFAPIGTQVSALATADPDAPAVTCDGRSLTRAELDASTNRLARAYAELGVTTGDYVSIAMPNSIGWVQSVLACWKLGAVPQPLSARLPDAEFTGLLDLMPRALVVGRTDPRGVVPSLPADFEPDAALSDAPLPEAVSPVWKSMTSGGSTGRPKLIEAGGDSRLPPAIGDPLGMAQDDVNLLSVPLHHNTGFTTATAGLLMGHHLVVMPRFDPHEFLRLVTEHRVTYLATVPTVMQRLLPVYRADPDAYDLSSIRRFWHLAAPCPPVVKQAWIDVLGPEVVWELYGGTELQALTFVSGTQWLRHPGTVGTVVAGEMRVLDDDGPDRFFFLSDRRVDMFTVGGRNVYPAEVESALAEHPEVLSCLVVGVPDDDLGQVPYALVEAASTLDESAVLAFLSERLAGHKVPRTVEFVDRPLRDEAGKARRSAVREDVISRLAAQSN